MKFSKVLSKLQFVVSNFQIFDHPDYHRWVVGESTPSTFAFDAMPYDDVYVGGGTMPSYFHQSLLFKTYKFSGVIYDLNVNGRNIGLWNYLRSEGKRV